MRHLLSGAQWGGMVYSEPMPAVGIAMATLCFLTALALSPWRVGARAALLAWAKENGLELVAARRRSYWYRLFRLPRTTGQPIYEIHVRDRFGGESHGVARVGGFFGLGSHVSVAWDSGEMDGGESCD